MILRMVVSDMSKEKSQTSVALSGGRVVGLTYLLMKLPRVATYEV